MAMIAPLISLYWGSLMIGRLTGSTGLFNIGKTAQNIAAVVLPFVFFGLVLGVIRIAGHNIEPLLVYVFPIAACVAAVPAE